MGSSNKTYKYTKPQPFVLPTTFYIPGVPPIGIPRETFFYSSIVIEDIMKNIDDEYEARGKIKPTWKRYKAGTDDYATFRPDPKNGSNLSRMALKFLPAIIKDIQNAIESLVKDSNYPDDLGSYQTRIFGDSTIHNPKGTWSSKTRIRNGYIVPATNTEGKQTLDPLTNIIQNKWAFPVDSGNYGGEGHIENPLFRMGIGFDGTTFIENKEGSIESKASDWPASVIGKKRTQAGIAIVDGQLVTKTGSSVTGIDGVQLPMIPEGRPGAASRKNEENTSQGVGKGLYDPDAGYTFLGQHPFIIQQLRWQPPIIERFDSDNIPLANYTQRIFSNTTPNLGFVFSNPSEKTWFFNWGQWLVKGKAKTDASTGLNLIASPEQFEGFTFTDCPFSVFYPPTSVICSCHQADTSYAVWGAAGDSLVWNSTALVQSGSEHTLPKRFGPKTRLRVKHTYSPVVGSPTPRHYYVIAIRLASISTVNLQPFIPIFINTVSDPDITLLNYIAVKTVSQESHTDGSKSVNIIEAIKKSYPQYNKTTDFITAMAIFVNQQVSGSKTCNVLDGAGGSFIDPVCSASLTCEMGTISSTTRYIQLYEPAFTNETDIRLP